MMPRESMNHPMEETGHDWLYPLLIVAAISVAAISGLGIATITGLL